MVVARFYLVLAVHAAAQTRGPAGDDCSATGTWANPSTPPTASPPHLAHLAALATAGFGRADIVTLNAVILSLKEQQPSDAPAHHPLAIFLAAARADRTALKGEGGAETARLFHKASNLYTDFIARVSQHGDFGRAAHLRLAAIFFRFSQCRDAAKVLETWVAGPASHSDIAAKVALSTILMDCPGWSRDLAMPPGARWHRALDVLSTVKIDDARVLLLQGRIRARPPRGSTELQNSTEAVALFRKAAAVSPSIARGVRARAYWQELGMALGRLRDRRAATAAHAEAAALGVWPSEWQRPAQSVGDDSKGLNLRATPWWQLSDLPSNYQAAIERLLARQAELIAEGLQLLRAHALGGSSLFANEIEGITLSGQWLELVLFDQGIESETRGCHFAPFICGAVEHLLDSYAARVSGSQIKLSAISCDATVMPHCGRTDARLRLHLPLHVPKTFEWYIRAGDPAGWNTTRSWAVGVPLLLDDSFEHELWGTGEPSCCENIEEARYTIECFRLILIVDIWHPDLSLAQKQKLSSVRS
eukprot:m.476405 g.476405  ORF g.476405 m.476405 type:complete len:533 (+) comp40808_c0_seq1:171-1769(+)